MLEFFRRKVNLPQTSILSELVQPAEHFSDDLCESNKLIPISCRTNRFKNSFFPSSVSVYNKHYFIFNCINLYVNNGIILGIRKF